MAGRNTIASYVAAAMVVAAGATAATVVGGNGSPVRAASSRPVAAATPVTVVQDQYVDDVVYETSPESTTVAPWPVTPVAAVAPAATPAAATLVWSKSNSPAASVASTSEGDAHQPDTTVPVTPESKPAPTTTTAAPRVATSATTTTTTAAPSTPTTTWPPGTELPKDWPPGKPYPPIPPGCKKPHLEDNGVWNCEH